NIEIRIFNPLVNRDWFRNIELVINLDVAGRRMHNKVFITDNSSAIIGGRNIGDEYFDDRNNLNFVDLDLLTVGPIVNDISTSFNEYWDSPWAQPIEELSKTTIVKKQITTFRSKLRDKWHRAKNTLHFEAIQQSDFTKKIINKKIPFVWAEAELFYDKPEKLTTSTRAELNKNFAPQVMPFFEQAKKEVLIASPYFVPGSIGLNWLINMKQQGAEIKILTNSLSATDVIAVHAGYKKYRSILIKQKINIFELKSSAHGLFLKTRRIITGKSKTSLHAKYMSIDQQFVFIGSANIDPRSNSLNTEIGIMINSKELALQTAALFTRATSIENSYQLSINNKDLIWRTKDGEKEVSYVREPNTSIFRRLITFLLGLLPIESLL
ncbi:MAG: hypothetical protein IMF17_04635, partial [Proteobacteria bacterium]|nr:hypothetical protein [Pseudomonadota bacterium]